MDYNYFERIAALLNALAEHGITATIHSIYEGFQLRVPWYTPGDVACHRGTYGQLESYCFPWDDDDVTRDSVEGMTKRIIGLYNRKMGS